jgi:hypothetical protein
MRFQRTVSTIVLVFFVTGSLWFADCQASCMTLGSENHREHSIAPADKAMETHVSHMDHAALAHVLPIKVELQGAGCRTDLAVLQGPVRHEAQTQLAMLQSSPSFLTTATANHANETPLAHSLRKSPFRTVLRI